MKITFTGVGAVLVAGEICKVREARCSVSLCAVRRLYRLIIRIEYVP